MSKNIIQDLIKRNAKSLGQELGTLGSIVDSELGVIPTGFYDIDEKLLEVGGIVKGRITEINGSESGGKSTLSYIIAANCQQNPGNLGDNGVVVHIDVEQVLNDKAGQDWLRKHGVDLDNLIYSNEIIAEKVFHIIDVYCKEKVDLIIVDSVAGLLGAADSVEMAENAKDAQKKFTGGFNALSRVMANGLKQVSKSAREGNTAVIFINQIRDKVGAMKWEPSETTTGGRALKFFSSVRLRLDRKSDILEDKERVGVLIKAYVQKSKVSTPFRRTGVDTFGFIPIYFDGRKVSEFDSLIATAIEIGIVGRANKDGVLSNNGQFYVYGNIKERGKDAFIVALTDEMKDAIVADVKSNKDKVAVKQEEMQDIEEEDYEF